MRLSDWRGLAAALGFIFLLWQGGPLAAQPFPEKDLPPALQPWVKWALDGQPEKDCPAVNGEAVCAWPGKMNLTLQNSGGSFTQSVYISRPLYFPLPGDTAHWPQGVSVDGKAAVVLLIDEMPAVRVERGTHSLSGRFLWNELPDSLPVPAATAILELNVNGRGLPFPRRDEGGLLLLSAGEDEAAAGGDSVRLKIFRKLSDGIPHWLETRFEFEISGKAREIKLAGALYSQDGKPATPISVGGDLPARLDPDGTLRIQVRAGSFAVTVLAKLNGDGNVAAFAAPDLSVLQPGKNGALQFPMAEIWSFQKNERLRQVQAEGETPVDAARAEVPEFWRHLPAFSLEPRAVLTLNQSRRGAPEAPPDQIQLFRQFWLDQDGKGYSIRDQFSGQLSRTWRLDLAEPAELGRVTVDGEAQLITRAAGGGGGVELRASALNLEAESRLNKKTRRLSIVGWDVDAQSLQAILRLPPGWRLLGARGVDVLPGSWLGSWNLWALFFVLIVAAAMAKLADWRWGVTAFLTLTLCHGERGAPMAVWISLILATALLRVMPAHWVKKLIQIWWGVSVIILVLICAPFFLRQVRTAFYPQVGSPQQYDTRYSGSYELASGIVSGGRMDAPAAAPVPASEMPMEEKEIDASASSPMQTPPSRMNRAKAPQKKAKADGDEVQGLMNQMAQSQSSTNIDLSGDLSYGKSAGYVQEQDPHALIQTGAGLPDWNWSSYTLSWSGMVPKDHAVLLFLISPFWNFVLNILRVLLVSALAGRLLWLAFKSGALPPPADAGLPPDAEPLWSSPTLPSTALGLTGILLSLALVSSSTKAVAGEAPEPARSSVSGAASLPSPELLEEMKTKLTRPPLEPECGEACVGTGDLRLSLSGNELQITAEVHAGAPGAWPLPGPASVWVPRFVSLDGASASALVRMTDGFLYLKVETGTHRVELGGPLPEKDSLALQFGQPARHASASAPGWQVDGIRADGSSDETVQLSRKLQSGKGGETGGEGLYAPWLEVTRVLEIGVTWRVRTIIRRISPPGAPVVVKIPLLKGMLVTDAEHQVEDDSVRISLGRDEMETSFTATLKPMADVPLLLKAPDGMPWSEVWVLQCSPVWQCKATGLERVAHLAGGQLSEEFRPWPGEQLELVFTRPVGLDGRTLTIDAATLTLTPGVRMMEAGLALQARASRAGRIELSLPAGAQIQTLNIGGVEKPAALLNGKLPIDLEAGTQSVAVSWKQDGGLRAFFRAPKVGLGQSAVNARVTIYLPGERWLLFTGGPTWGPAVLFWGIFWVVVLAAYALGRLSFSPLKSWQWVLLVLGLTQIPLVGALCIAAWFLLFEWRRRDPLPTRWRFNLLQIALAGWTLLFIGLLYWAVHTGLLLLPDMQVEGYGSSATQLQWYQDRITAEMPTPWVLSLPMWSYRGLMFLWSFWLALSLVRWLAWSWRAYSTGGLWMKAPEKVAPATPPPLPK